MPPKFPWKAAIVFLIVLVLMGAILVNMWPGLRKPHRIEPAASRTVH